MPKNAKKNYARNVSFSDDSNAVKMPMMKSPGNGYYLPPSGRPLKSSPSVATLSRLERQNIVLWKRPFQTLNYFLRELFLQIFENFAKICRNKRLVAFLCFLGFLCYGLYVIPGPHSSLVKYFERKTAWCLYWVFLGVLSSVGLGTGLHTFLLYLGPHIASVTLAAYECQSLRFPEPPYPDQIVCPFGTNGAGGQNSSTPSQPAASANSNDVDELFDATIGTLAASSMISLWSIMGKVRLEAFMWGAGTALGELPPYFMAKAARLSGEEPDDEEYREFVDFMRQKEVERYGQDGQPRDLWARVKLAMQKLIESVGFLGILLCASIPNPLFDLAGITCGHFLVSFWTFFGATLIGKAIIKMHIQKLFVILAFSEHHVEKCVLALKRIPKVGPYLQSPFKELLVQQKKKFHQRIAEGSGGSQLDSQKNGILQRFFELIFVGMVAYFLVSLINSLAQNYDRRLYQQNKQLVVDETSKMKGSKCE